MKAGSKFANNKKSEMLTTDPFDNNNFRSSITQWTDSFADNDDPALLEDSHLDLIDSCQGFLTGKEPAPVAKSKHPNLESIPLIGMTKGDEIDAEHKKRSEDLRQMMERAGFTNEKLVTSGSKFNSNSGEEGVPGSDPLSIVTPKADKTRISDSLRKVTPFYL